MRPWHVLSAARGRSGGCARRGGGGGAGRAGGAAAASQSPPPEPRVRERPAATAAQHRAHHGPSRLPAGQPIAERPRERGGALLGSDWRRGEEGGTAAGRARVSEALPAAGAFERGNAGASGGFSRGFGRADGQGGRARREGAVTAALRGRVVAGLGGPSAAAERPAPFLPLSTGERARALSGRKGNGGGQGGGCPRGVVWLRGSSSSVRKRRAGSGAGAGVSVCPGRLGHRPVRTP